MAALRGMSPALRVECVRQALDVADAAEIPELAALLVDVAADAPRGRGDSPLDPRRLGRSVLNALRWSAASGEDAAAPERAAWMLIEHWSSLDEPLRAAVLGRARQRVTGVLTAAARDERPGARAGVAAVIAHTSEPSLMPLVVSLLGDPDEQVSGLAEQAVLAIARTGEASAVEDELARAASAFESHRRRAIVELALQRVPLGVGAEANRERSALARWAFDTESPASGALRWALRNSADPDTRRKAFELLVVGGLVAAAGDRLGRPATPAEHVSVLTNVHLIAHPRRAKALRTLTPARTDERVGGILPAPGAALKLNEPARAGLPVLAAAVGVPAPARSVWTNALINDPSPRVRWRAVRACARRDLADFAFDASEAVARSAILSWSSLGDGLEPVSNAEPLRLAGLFARSPHASVRAIGASELERLAWHQPGPVAGRVHARRLVRRDRAVMVGDLRQRLLAAEPAAIPSLAMLIRRLGLEREFAAELTAIAERPVVSAVAARAVATAVTVLERAPGPGAGMVIENASRSDDPRVRANAADAIGRRALAEPAEQERSHAVLLELKDDGHHRVRASALRGLATSATARGVSVRHADWRVIATGTTEMLNEARPEHKIAGLWLTQRVLSPLWAMGAIEGVSESVVRSARDPDERVRRRGLSCAALIAAMREQAERQEVPA